MLRTGIQIIERGDGMLDAYARIPIAFAVAEVKRGCRELKIETPNVNAGACRFWAQQGCVLHRVHRRAYPQFPDEIQLLWYKKLAHDS